MRGGGISDPLLTLSQSELLQRLDSLVARRQEAIRLKLRRIDTYRDDLRKSRSPRDGYTAALHLYNEFLKFQLDSALHYSDRLEAYARQSGDPRQINAARIARCKNLIFLGMYKAAADQLDAVTADGARVDSVDYYNCYLKLYHAMTQTAMAESLHKEYNRLKSLYRDSILMVVDSNRLTCTLMRHDKRSQENGDPHESIRELSAFFARNDNSISNKAVIANSLADAYGRLNDEEQHLRYLTLTAIYDLEIPNLEYSALPRLANRLFEQGDLVRANRYITRSLEDAIACNSVNRILIAARTMTEINQSFMLKIARHQNRLYLLLAVVTGTILLLSGILVYTLRQKRIIKQLQTQHSQDNERLRELNERLSATNRQQETINDALSESNTVKDKYIRHYMQLSTLYINKLERFRVQLFKTFNTHGLDRLLRELRSPSSTEREYKAFFNEFDSVFLSIYPDFIEQVNALLLETERLKSDKLNTEFRLLAVIRLGITDSAQIAQFLHISINTVYTYRNRLRNAATSPKEFEKQIMEIG